MDDLREGLGLIFRAAVGVARMKAVEVAKDFDIGKAARNVGRVAEQASKEIARVATLFGETFEDESATLAKDGEPLQDGVGGELAEPPAEEDA